MNLQHFLEMQIVMLVVVLQIVLVWQHLRKGKVKAQQLSEEQVPPQTGFSIRLELRSVSRMATFEGQPRIPLVD